VGIQSGLFLYWLIYDRKLRTLNLKLLLDLAEATRGSFGDFKTYIVAYWVLKKLNTADSVAMFYGTLLPSIQ
jgi:hypothetical protein